MSEKPTESASQKAVVGVILFDGNDAMAKCVAAGATGEWFFGTEGKVWELAFEVFQSGKQIDPIKLMDRAKEEHGFDTEINSNYIAAVQDAVYPSNLSVYLGMLEAEYLIRTSVRQAEASLARLKACTKDDIKETLAVVQSDWAKCGTITATDDIPMHEVAQRVIDEWVKVPEPKECLQWPLSCMNAKMAPITDEYIIVGARQSVGKTAFALQMAVSNGLNGVRVSLSSMESKKPKIAMRMLSHIAKINTLVMRRRENGFEEGLLLARKAVDKIKELPFTVSDAGMSVEQLRAWAIGEKAKGSRMIIIDNFKHIRPSRKYPSPVEQFRDISVQLKWIRDDVGIAVMCLHHLNKEGDLSWSDDIWRDADIVMTLKDSEKQPPLDPRDKHPPFMSVDIEVPKDRDGMKNLQFPVEFHTAVQTFYSGAGGA